MDTAETDINTIEADYATKNELTDVDNDKQNKIDQINADIDDVNDDIADVITNYNASD